jgi:hypothetical protein
MESDLIHHQQVGSQKVDLLAGLSDDFFAGSRKDDAAQEKRAKLKG